METAAVPAAERTRPGPLAALALVVAIPGTFVLGVWDLQLQEWATSPHVWLAFLTGSAAVVFVGRRTFGVARSVGLAISTWATLLISVFVFIALAFAEAFNCGATSHPFHAWVAVAGGVVYVAVAFWALRKGRWWGPPVAILVALAFFVILTEALPGVPNSGDCSD
jgi:hypothetical protein